MAMERVNGGACGGRGGPKDVLSASHAHGIDGDHGQAAWKYRRPSTRQSGRTTAHATESRTARALVPHSCATARCSEQARRKAGVRDAIVTGIGCADIAEIAAERVWQAKCRASGGGTNKAKSPMSPMDTEVAGATETCASKIASGHIGGRRGGRAGRAPKDGEIYCWRGDNSNLAESRSSTSIRAGAERAGHARTGIVHRHRFRANSRLALPRQRR